MGVSRPLVSRRTHILRADGSDSTLGAGQFKANVLRARLPVTAACTSTLTPALSNAG